MSTIAENKSTKFDGCNLFALTRNGGEPVGGGGAGFAAESTDRRGTMATRPDKAGAYCCPPPELFRLIFVFVFVFWRTHAGGRRQEKKRKSKQQETETITVSYCLHHEGQ